MNCQTSGSSKNRLQVTSGLESIHSFNKWILKAYNSRSPLVFSSVSTWMNEYISLCI